MKDTKLQTSSKTKAKKSIKVFKILISLLILFFLVKTNKLNLNFILHSGISPYILLIVLLLNYLRFIIASIRYTILLIAQGIEIKNIQMLSWTLKSRFLDTLLPSSFGGDGYKIYMLNKYIIEQKSKKELDIENPLLLFSIVSSLADKAFALSGLFLVSSLSLSLIYLFNIDIIYLNINIFISISSSLTLLFILFIYIVEKCDISRIYFVDKFKNIRYLGSLINESIKILIGLKKQSSSLYSIIALSILTQCISLLGLLIIISTVYDFYLEFYLLFFFIIPLAFVTNLLGFFGGFGLGTLGIGYCLNLYLGIEDGYNLIFLTQSISFLAKISCSLSWLYDYKKTFMRKI